MTRVALPSLIFAIALLGTACGGSSGGGGGGGVSGGYGPPPGQVPPPPPPPPPAGFEMLDYAFDAEEWLPNLEVPVKMALAPDGRLFYSELRTGNVRVVDALGNLLPTPFASMSVLGIAEQGLLGIALPADFDTTGEVYVCACVPGPPQDRQQVVRYIDVASVGVFDAVVVDDLPVGIFQNGGDIQFGPDDKLYVSIGDTGDMTLSQLDGSLAGRILRYERDGTIPVDNPDPLSPEYVRGLRNSFDMAFHPVTGALFASENGPTDNDELNLILPGKNFEWPALPPTWPGSLIGNNIIAYTPVIVPTGIAWHDGTQFGQSFADNIFMCTYDEGLIRRLVMSGFYPADLDFEIEFARFVENGIDNKPLDIVVAPDGTLFVSTFTSIWRIWRK